MKTGAPKTRSLYQKQRTTLVELTLEKSRHGCWMQTTVDVLTDDLPKLLQPVLEGEQVGLTVDRRLIHMIQKLLA